jgi:hypothetical protein
MTREIPLSGRLGAGKVALVDDEDYAYLAQFRWYFTRSHYARAGHEGYARRMEGNRKVGRRYVFMHHEIVRPAHGLEVDHIRPGSGLDNRRRNLRVLTRGENARNCRIQCNNTSGYRGVRWITKREAWVATIMHRGKSHYLGQFMTAEEAAAAYENARASMGLLKAEVDRPPAA